MDTDAPATSPEILRRDPVPTAVVRGSARMEELPHLFDRAYPLVASVLAEQGVPPLEAVGYYLSPPGDTMDLEVGFTTAAPAQEDGEVVVSSLPGGDVARLSHVGPYDELARSWGVLADWIQEQGRRPGPTYWETYVTEPTPETDPRTLRTDLFWSLAG